MIVLQAVAALAVGLPYPGGQSGAAFLAGPKPLEVSGLGFVKAETTAYWLINSKGYIVRSFPANVSVPEITEWLNGTSLPRGYVAADPRRTVSVLPELGPLRSWMDVVAMGWRFLRQSRAEATPRGTGLLVLFLSSYGPADHLYTERLNAIFEDSAGAGLETIALFPGKEESKASVARFVALHRLKFPCAVDSGNAYADAFRASRTPEVFLLDIDLRVVYTGAIDDSTFGGDAVRRYLANAIDDHKNGRAVRNAATRVFGTPIDR